MRKICKITAAILSLAMAVAPAALAGCDTEKPSDQPPVVQPEEVKVTGVSLAAEGGAQSVLVGATLQLTATVAPSNATNKAVTYSSSDDRIATVNAGGLVTGVSAGEVTVTVTTADGNRTANLTLTVQANEVKVTGVSLTAEGNETSVTVDGTLQLTATVTPSDATNKAVTYSSSDDRIATVNADGLVW